jgi:1,6-anhydro-N-acetylmuramate kinase
MPLRKRPALVVAERRGLVAFAQFIAQFAGCHHAHLRGVEIGEPGQTYFHSGGGVTAADVENTLRTLSFRSAGRGTS